MFPLTAPIVLASQSPRRHQLMKSTGWDFEVVVRPVDEPIPAGFSPREVAMFLAEHKAKAYTDIARDKIVVTADTLVVRDEELIGKPKDEADAFNMLKSLVGRSHGVVSGVALYHQEQIHSFVEETRVHFVPLSDEEIRYYIDTCHPLDKAGAYGIQDWIGMVGISGLEGDYYNVMGLPVYRLYKEMKMFRL